MKHNIIHRTALAVALTVFASSAMASGSEGGAAAQTGDMQLYNAGKAVYAQKLACDTCPLAGKSLDATLASDLIAGKGVPTLSEGDSKALMTYLKRRFKMM